MFALLHSRETIAVMSAENVNAWWAREDSNLQPDRYERGYLIGSIDDI